LVLSQLANEDLLETWEYIAEQENKDLVREILATPWAKPNSTPPYAAVPSASAPPPAKFPRFSARFEN
jgi:hypothetical protein